MIFRSGRGALKIISLLCLLLAFRLPAHANHLFGGELFYTYISGNTYTVTMILYGDCGSSSAAAFAGLPTATPQVEVYNGTSLIQTLSLAPQPGSGVDVSPVCPDEINNTKCVNPNNLLPGVKKFIYAANVTLSGPSANWRFRSNGNLGNSQSGRSTSITNIVIPSPTTLMSLEAMLNNTTAFNSSPTYTTIPTPFFCINKPQEYNQGAVDANGDSLTFQLVTGLDATVAPSANVTYIAPATAVAPLLCLPGSYSFNVTNGQLSFYPNAVQNALVVSRVSEYRNGVLVGTSMREMTFVVLNNCNNNPPDGTISSPVNGILVNGTTVKVCSFAGTMSFGITTTDLDGDNVTLSVQGTPAGASISISNNGTPSPSLNFSWNVTNVAPGDYTFYVTFSDDGCPLVSKQTVAYTVKVLAKPAMLYALTEPATCIKKGVFTVTPVGTDAPYSLNVLQGTTPVLTRSNITGLITDSLTAGNYTFRITGANGCYADTLITIIQNATAVPQVSWTQPFCPGGNTATITVTATGVYPPFQYSVNALPYSTVNTFNGLTAGTHTVHVRDAAGCIKDTSITITNPPGMTLVLSVKKPVCSPVSNGQITVAASNGSAPYQYALNAGAYSATATFGGLATGSYTIHVKDAHNCLKDTVITLVDSLHMQLQAVVSPVLCYGGSTGSVTLNPSGTTAPYAFAIGAGTFGASGVFGSLATGSYVFHVRDQNQCLKDTTIMVTQPAPLALALNVVQVACYGTNGGAVTVLAQGGTPAYQYAIDSGPFQAGSLFSNLVAGTYTVHLKDNNGCLKDTVITITQPASAVQFGPLNIITPTCESYTDGSVTLSANGGTSPYLFGVNNNGFSSSAMFAGLSEGSYTFKVKDNNGCTRDTLLTLIGFPHILIDGVTLTEPACNGYGDGEITIHASGGKPPFSYQLDNSNNWTASPVFQNKDARGYTISIRDDNQCLKDTTIILGQPEPLVIEKETSGNDCNGIDDGGIIEILASGGTEPYEYFWQHNNDLHRAKITGLINGRYYITLKDAHNCTDSAIIDILYNNCCTPFIPNAFSPNGDGKNDGYKVVYKGDMELKEMYVYNRYGQRVFSSANVDKTWDGTFNGQAVDAGSYFYYIRILCGNVRKKELIFKGDVTVIR